MKIAVPVWNDRVSPVFDTSGHLLVVELVDGEEVSRGEHAVTDTFPPFRVRRLKELGVELLICGAISNPVACLLDAAGISLMPWVIGDVNDVLDAYKRERLADSRYRMPGCRGRGRSPRRGMRHARRHGFGQGGGGFSGRWHDTEEGRDEDSGNIER